MELSRIARLRDGTKFRFFLQKILEFVEVVGASGSDED